MKKLICLMGMLVLVSGCDLVQSQEGDAKTSGYANKDCICVNSNDRAFFDFDSSKLSSEGQAMIDSQAKWLKKNPAVDVTVQGYTDERGTREYNIALGERRATAVKNYLISDGVSAKRIKTISYGKERPAEDGHDEDAWSKNRRAVTVVDGQ